MRLMEYTTMLYPHARSEPNVSSRGIFVPGRWSAKHGHDLMEDVERDIHQVLPSVTVFTHIELLEDPRSWEGEGFFH